MSENKDDISLSSDIEDDSISNLVIDHMNVNEIADYIDMNWHECNDTMKNLQNKIFYNILILIIISKPKKEH